MARGRSLIWDVTVSCTTADSYLEASSREAGAAAELRHLTIIKLIIIRNLYSAIMPLGGYRGAGGTGR